MSQRLERFIADIPQKSRHWMTYVGRPYIRAYDDAYAKFQAKIAEQRAADLARAQLLITAVSIATGSLLMAAFASSSVRTVAGQQALNFICNRNMERTFNAVHWVVSRKWANFAVGEILTRVQGALQSKFDDAIKKSIEGNSALRTESVINYLTHIEDFIDINASLAHTTAALTRDSGAPTSVKDTVAMTLEAAPFANPPTASVVTEARLAQKMELSFYMAAILNSDYIQQSTFHGMVRGGGVMTTGARRPIDQLPDARDYPRATSRAVPNRPAMTEYQTPKVDTMGGEIRDRVDELHTSVFGTSFYGDDGWFYQSTHQDLVRAQQTLNRIGNIMQPPMNPRAFTS